MSEGGNLDDLDVLEGLLESVLIQYEYDTGLRIFRMTTDYWRKAAGASRAFIELVFSDVSDFERVTGEDKRQQKYLESYTLREAPCPEVVQLAEATPTMDGRMVATISFGHSLGRIRLFFSHVHYSVRQTSAVENHGRWRYTDLDTGDEVCFYDPFGRELIRGSC